MTARPRLDDHELWRLSDPPGPVTVGRPALWDDVWPAERVLSHRATTSSRHPGRVFAGAVSFDLVAPLVPCSDCGTWRRDTGGPHSPRWSQVDGEHVLVDCAGRRISTTDGA